MSKSTLSPAESMQVLTDAYALPKTVSYSATALTDVMFRLLDVMPGWTTTNDVMDKISYSTQAWRAMCRALRTMDCVRTENTGDFTTALRISATDRLVSVARGFNQVYLGFVGDYTGLESQTIVERSIRKMAVSHGFDHFDKESSPKEIGATLMDQTNRHPLSITHAALSGFAFDRNVGYNVEGAVKDIILGREALPVRPSMGS